MPLEHIQINAHFVGSVTRQGSGKLLRYGCACGLPGEHRSPSDYCPGGQVPPKLSTTSWLTTLPFSSVIIRYFSSRGWGHCGFKALALGGNLSFPVNQVAATGPVWPGNRAFSPTPPLPQVATVAAPLFRPQGSPLQATVKTAH
jgi:hypothetical protein